MSQLLPVPIKTEEVDQPETSTKNNAEKPPNDGFPNDGPPNDGPPNNGSPQTQIHLHQIITDEGRVVFRLDETVAVSSTTSKCDDRVVPKTEPDEPESDSVFPIGQVLGTLKPFTKDKEGTRKVGLRSTSPDTTESISLDRGIHDRLTQDRSSNDAVTHGDSRDSTLGDTRNSATTCVTQKNATHGPVTHDHLAPNITPSSIDICDLKQEPSNTAETPSSDSSGSTVLSEGSKPQDSKTHHSDTSNRLVPLECNKTFDKNVSCDRTKISETSGNTSKDCAQNTQRTGAVDQNVSGGKDSGSSTENKTQKTPEESIAMETSTPTAAIEPRFTCEECKRTFEDSAIFELHKKKHLRQKPFHCTQCRRSFTSYFILMQHLNVHSKSASKNKDTFTLKENDNEKDKLKDTSHERNKEKQAQNAANEKSVYSGNTDVAYGFCATESPLPKVVSPPALSPPASRVASSPSAALSPLKDPYQSPHSSSQISEKFGDSGKDLGKILCEKSTSPGLVSSTSESQKIVPKIESERLETQETLTKDSKDSCTSSTSDSISAIAKTDSLCEPSTSDSADCFIVSYKKRSNTDQNSKTSPMSRSPKSVFSQSKTVTLDSDSTKNSEKLSGKVDFLPKDSVESSNLQQDGFSVAAESSKPSCVVMSAAQDGVKDHSLPSSDSRDNSSTEKPEINILKESKNTPENVSLSPECSSKTQAESKNNSNDLNKIITIDLSCITDDSSQASSVNSMCVDSQDSQDSCSQSSKDRHFAKERTLLESSLRFPVRFPSCSSADVNESKMWSKMVEEDNSQSSIIDRQSTNCETEQSISDKLSVTDTDKELSDTDENLSGTDKLSFPLTDRHQTVSLTESQNCQSSRTSTLPSSCSTMHKDIPKTVTQCQKSSSCHTVSQNQSSSSVTSHKSDLLKDATSTAKEQHPTICNLLLKSSGVHEKNKGLMKQGASVKGNFKNVDSNVRENEKIESIAKVSDRKSARDTGPKTSQTTLGTKSSEDRCVDSAKNSCTEKSNLTHKSSDSDTSSNAKTSDTGVDVKESVSTREEVLTNTTSTSQSSRPLRTTTAGDSSNTASTPGPQQVSDNSAEPSSHPPPSDQKDSEAASNAKTSSEEIDYNEWIKMLSGGGESSNAVSTGNANDGENTDSEKASTEITKGDSGRTNVNDCEKFPLSVSATGSSAVNVSVRATRFNSGCMSASSSKVSTGSQSVVKGLQTQKSGEPTQGEVGESNESTQPMKPPGKKRGRKPKRKTVSPRSCGITGGVDNVGSLSVSDNCMEMVQERSNVDKPESKTGSKNESENIVNLQKDCMSASAVQSAICGSKSLESAPLKGKDPVNESQENGKSSEISVTENIHKNQKANASNTESIPSVQKFGDNNRDSKISKSDHGMNQGSGISCASVSMHVAAALGKGQAQSGLNQEQGEEKKFYGTGAVISQRMLDRIAELKGKIKKVKKHKKKKHKDLCSCEAASSTDTDVTMGTDKSIGKNDQMIDRVAGVNVEASKTFQQSVKSRDGFSVPESGQILPKKKKKKHKKDKLHSKNHPEITKKKKRKKCKDCKITGEKCPHIKKKKKKKKKDKLKLNNVLACSAVSSTFPSIDTVCDTADTASTSFHTCSSAVESDLASEVSVNVAKTGSAVYSASTVDQMEGLSKDTVQVSENQGVSGNPNASASQNASSSNQTESKISGPWKSHSAKNSSATALTTITTDNIAVGDRLRTRGNATLTSNSGTSKDSTSSAPSAAKKSPAGRLKAPTSPRRPGRPSLKEKKEINPTMGAAGRGTSRALRNRFNIAKPNSYGTTSNEGHPAQRGNSKLPPAMCKMTRLPNGRLFREITGPLPVRSQLYFLKHLRNSTEEKTEESTKEDGAKHQSDVEASVGEDSSKTTECCDAPDSIVDSSNTQIQPGGRDTTQVQETVDQMPPQKDEEANIVLNTECTEQSTAVAVGTENMEKVAEAGEKAQDEQDTQDNTDAESFDDNATIIQEDLPDVQSLSDFGVVPESVAESVAESLVEAGPPDSALDSVSSIPDQDDRNTASVDTIQSMQSVQSCNTTRSETPSDVGSSNSEVVRKTAVIRLGSESIRLEYADDTSSLSSAKTQDVLQDTQSEMSQSEMSQDQGLSQDLNSAQEDVTDTTAYRKSPKRPKTKEKLEKSGKKFEWNDIQEAISAGKKKKKKKRQQCECQEVTNLGMSMGNIDLGPIVPRTEPVGYNFVSVLEGCPLFANSETLCTSLPGLATEGVDIKQEDDGQTAEVANDRENEATTGGSNAVVDGVDTGAVPTDLPVSDSPLETPLPIQSPHMPLILNLPMQSSVYQQPLQYILPAGSQYALPLSVQSQSNSQISFIPNLQNFSNLQNFQNLSGIQHLQNLQNYQMPFQNIQNLQNFQQPLLQNYTIPQSVPLVQNLHNFQFQQQQTIPALQNLLSPPGANIQQQSTQVTQQTISLVQNVQNIVQQDNPGLTSPNHVILPQQNAVPQTLQTIQTLPQVQAVQLVQQNIQQTVQNVQNIQPNQGVIQQNQAQQSHPIQVPDVPFAQQSHPIQVPDVPFAQQIHAFPVPDVPFAQPRWKNQRFILPAPAKETHFTKILMKPHELLGPTFASVAKAGKTNKQSVPNEWNAENQEKSEVSVAVQQTEVSPSKSPAIDEGMRSVNTIQNVADKATESHQSDTNDSSKLTTPASNLAAVAKNTEIRLTEEKSKVTSVQNADANNPSNGTPIKVSETPESSNSSSTTSTPGPKSASTPKTPKSANKKISPPLTRSKRHQDSNVRSLRSGKMQRKVLNLIHGDRKPRSRSNSESRFNSIPSSRSNNRSRTSTPEPDQLKSKNDKSIKQKAEGGPTEDLSAVSSSSKCTNPEALGSQNLTEGNKNISSSSRSKKPTEERKGSKYQESSETASSVQDSNGDDDNDIYNFSDTEDYFEDESDATCTNQKYEKDSVVSERECVQSPPGTSQNSQGFEGEGKSTPNSEHGVVSGSKDGENSKSSTLDKSEENQSEQAGTQEKTNEILAPASGIPRSTEEITQTKKTLIRPRVLPLKRNNPVKLPRIPQDQLIGISRRGCRSTVLTSTQKYERVKLIINNSLENVKASINIDNGCSFEEKLVKELNNGLNACKELHDGLPRSRGFPKLAISKDLSSLKILIFWEIGKEPCTVTITQNQSPAPKANQSPEALPSITPSGQNVNDQTSPKISPTTSIASRSPESAEVHGSSSSSPSQNMGNLTPKKLVGSRPKKIISKSAVQGSVGSAGKFTVSSRRTPGKGSATKFRVASKGALISVRTVRDKPGSQNQQENNQTSPSKSQSQQPGAGPVSVDQKGNASAHGAQSSSTAASTSSTTASQPSCSGNSVGSGATVTPENTQESKECNDTSSILREDELTFKFTRSSFQGKTYNNRKRKRDEVSAEVENVHTEKPFNPEKANKEDDAFEKAKSVGCPSQDSPEKVGPTQESTSKDLTNKIEDQIGGNLGEKIENPKADIPVAIEDADVGEVTCSSSHTKPNTVGNAGEESCGTEQLRDEPQKKEQGDPIVSKEQKDGTEVHTGKPCLSTDTECMEDLDDTVDHESDTDNSEGSQPGAENSDDNGKNEESSEESSSKKPSEKYYLSASELLGFRPQKSHSDKTTASEKSDGCIDNTEDTAETEKTTDGTKVGRPRKPKEMKLRSGFKVLTVKKGKSGKTSPVKTRASTRSSLSPGGNIEVGDEAGSPFRKLAKLSATCTQTISNSLIRSMFSDDAQCQIPKQSEGAGSTESPSTSIVISTRKTSLVSPKVGLSASVISSKIILQSKTGKTKIEDKNDPSTVSSIKAGCSETPCKAEQNEIAKSTASSVSSRTDDSNPTGATTTVTGPATSAVLKSVVALKLKQIIDSVCDSQESESYESSIVDTSASEAGKTQGDPDLKTTVQNSESLTNDDAEVPELVSAPTTPPDLTCSAVELDSIIGMTELDLEPEKPAMLDDSFGANDTEEDSVKEAVDCILEMLDGEKDKAAMMPSDISSEQEDQDNINTLAHETQQLNSQAVPNTCIDTQSASVVRTMDYMLGVLENDKISGSHSNAHLDHSYTSKLVELTNAKIDSKLDTPVKFGKPKSQPKSRSKSLDTARSEIANCSKIGMRPSYSDHRIKDCYVNLECIDIEEEISLLKSAAGSWSAWSLSTRRTLKRRESTDCIPVYPLGTVEIKNCFVKLKKMKVENKNVVADSKSEIPKSECAVEYTQHAFETELQEKTSGDKEKTPAQDETTGQDEISPVHSENEKATGQDNTIIQQDETTVIQDMITVLHKANTDQDETVVQDQTSLVQDQTSLVQDQTSLVQDQTSSAEDTRTVPDETPPGQKKILPQDKAKGRPLSSTSESQANTKESQAGIVALEQQEAVESQLNSEESQSNTGSVSMLAERAKESQASTEMSHSSTEWSKSITKLSQSNARSVSVVEHGAKESQSSTEESHSSTEKSHSSTEKSQSCPEGSQSSTEGTQSVKSQSTVFTDQQELTVSQSSLIPVGLDKTAEHESLESYTESFDLSKGQNRTPSIPEEVDDVVQSLVNEVVQSEGTCIINMTAGSEAENTRNDIVSSTSPLRSVESTSQKGLASSDAYSVLRKLLCTDSMNSVSSEIGTFNRISCSSPMNNAKDTTRKRRASSDDYTVLRKMLCTDPKNYDSLKKDGFPLTDTSRAESVSKSKCGPLVSRRSSADSALN